MLPPDGSIAVPLYSAVQLQRGGVFVGDVAQIRASLSSCDGGPAGASDTQVPNSSPFCKPDGGVDL